MAGRMSLCFVVVASCLAFQFTAGGQEARAQPEPVPQAATASRPALQLLELTRAGANALAVIDAMKQTMIAQIRRDNPSADEATLQEFSAALHDEFEMSIDDYLALTAKVYEKYYTADELQALIAFYGSPVGQKTIAATPQLMKELLPVSAEWGRIAGTRAYQRAVERLKPKGLRL